MAEKNYDISKLLDIYGDILSDRQRLAVELYYNEDLSLSEISDEMGISRQGVRASLKKSEETLCSMEEKLGFAARFDKTVKRCEWLNELAQEMKQKSSGGELAFYAEKIASFVQNIEQDIE